MVAFGQTVRDVPTTDITEAERVLRARLVVEEALEFAEAMGCWVKAPAGGTFVSPASVEVLLDPAGSVDLVEATDAIGDLTVVTKGSALTLGVPCDEVLEVIHETNMAKLGPDGRPVLREEDGKVVKPEGWQPPTAGIAALLVERGWRQ